MPTVQRGLIDRAKFPAVVASYARWTELTMRTPSNLADQLTGLAVSHAHATREEGVVIAGKIRRRPREHANGKVSTRRRSAKPLIRQAKAEGLAVTAIVWGADGSITIETDARALHDTISPLQEWRARRARQT